MGEETRFAYGDVLVGDAKCPAAASSLDESGMVMEVAEMYDIVCAEWFDADEGVIINDDAESAWNEAIERLEQTAHEWELDDPEHSEHLRKEIIPLGQQVAEKVFA